MAWVAGLPEDKLPEVTVDPTNHTTYSERYSTDTTFKAALGQSLWC